MYTCTFMETQPIMLITVRPKRKEWGFLWDHNPGPYTPPQELILYQCHQFATHPNNLGILALNLNSQHRSVPLFEQTRECVSWYSTRAFRSLRKLVHVHVGSMCTCTYTKIPASKNVMQWSTLQTFGSTLYITLSDHFTCTVHVKVVYFHAFSASTGRVNPIKR